MKMTHTRRRRRREGCGQLMRMGATKREAMGRCVGEKNGGGGGSETTKDVVATE